MAGLAIGVSSMKAGEHALLHVSWELGYGKEGSFSFPNVPPMADLIYEVELIGFDEAKEVSFAFLNWRCRHAILLPLPFEDWNPLWIWLQSILLYL